MSAAGPACTPLLSPGSTFLVFVGGHTRLFQVQLLISCPLSPWPSQLLAAVPLQALGNSSPSADGDICFPSEPLPSLSHFAGLRQTFLSSPHPGCLLARWGGHCWFIKQSSIVSSLLSELRATSGLQMPSVPCRYQRFTCPLGSAHFVFGCCYCALWH